MSKSKGRVIRGFQERRELEDALQRLSRLTDEASRHTLAQELAQKGEPVVPVLLRHLGTTNPLLRGAIGLVAHYLPRELIAPPLREITANPQRSDQERMAALMILERFLDEPIEDSVYASLRDPEAVIQQSLREVCEYQDTIPDIVLDYVAQLQEEPIDVSLAVMDYMRDFPADQVIPILRLLAQDIRVPVARRAIQVLGQTPHPNALASLEVLRDLVPAPLQQEAERAARKLRLRSVSAAHPAPQQWRALVTPPDAQGTQAFWLLRPRDDDAWHLLGVLANMGLGVQFAFVLEHVPADFVASSPGEPVLLPLAGRDEAYGMAWFMEVPLSFARRWLRQLTWQNYHTAYQTPVVYRHHVISFWLETQTEGFADPPNLPPPEPEQVWHTLELLQHPALDSWYIEPPRTAFQEHQWLQAGLSTDALHEALQHIPGELFSQEQWNALAERLEYLAEWFLAAEDTERAQLTISAAHALRSLPYEQNPFAQALVARGLMLIFEELQREKERWDD